MWPDARIIDLLGIVLPIIQAPMAGAAGSAMTIAVAEAGGLGSLACAMLNEDQLQSELALIRRATEKPINLNFFCNAPEPFDAGRERAWRERLRPYFLELGVDPEATAPGASRTPFGVGACALVEEWKPEVVSFHFGLPAPDLLARVKNTGAKILASATTVAEARWLADHGCDAIIAQGVEAGGHRGNFLAHDMATQLGTMALVPQVADAVKIPVIAAGGIGDGRGVAASFALGASAAQLGTAYLFASEAKISPLHLAALQSPRSGETALTNLFSGLPARAIVNRVMREVGPLSDLAPAFPLAGAALLPLRQKAEHSGSDDFTQLWSGEAAQLGRALPAGELTRLLARETLAEFARLRT